MPNEPERPIEERLRAYAKKRRHEAGDPLQLHPATRRLLQGEVARQFAKQERLPRSLLPQFKQFWPRLTSAFAILALLALAAWLFLPGRVKQEMTLAKSERSPGAVLDELKSSPAARPPIVATEADRRADDSKLNREIRPQSQLGLEAGQAQTEKERLLTLSDTITAAGSRSKSATSPDQPSASTRSVGVLGGAVASSRLDDGAQSFGVNRDRAASAHGPAAALQPSTPGQNIVAETAKPVPSDHEFNGKPDNSPRGELAYKSLTVAPTAPAPAVSGKDTVAFFGDLQKNKDSSTQRFNRTGLRSEAARLLSEPLAAKLVLASFQLERTGREVRIVDADGSVYAGYVQAPVSAPPLTVSAGEKKPADKALEEAEKKQEQKAADGSQSQPLLNYGFRVAGTNRTLNEQVVFTGSVFASTSETLFKQITNGLTSGSAQSTALPSDPALLPTVRSPNSRISGRASIGGRSEIEVNASPVSP